MTKLRCRNRENDKYIDGIRDLTVAREAGLAKIGHGMRDLCLRVCRECRKLSRPTGSSGQSESTRQCARVQDDRSRFHIVLFLHTDRGTKSYFFLQKPLKTRVNSKYQSKGSTYILHFLAFVEIRLFNVFSWERKAGFGKLMKNVRNAGFSRKRGGNAGSGPLLPGP